MNLGNLKGSLDSVIIDPPFFSSDCQTKCKIIYYLPVATFHTVQILGHGTIATRQLSDTNMASSLVALTGRWLVKPKSPRVIVCTGERMAPIIDKLYRSLGVYATTFEPAHAGLSNHYYCYANFESSTWDWRSDESD